MLAIFSFSNFAKGQTAYEAVKSRIAEYLRDNFKSKNTDNGELGGMLLFTPDIYTYGNISLTDVSNGSNGTLEVTGTFIAESKKNSSKTTKYYFKATLKQVLDNYTVQSLKARDSYDAASDRAYNFY